MIDPEVSEQEATATRVDPSGDAVQTTTRTTGTATPVASRLQSLVWLAVGVVAVILALDFVFKLLASANVGFVGFISTVAGSLAAPFRGVLASSVPRSGHYFYWADIVAIVVFLIAAGIVVSLIGITTGRRSAQTTRV
ncbi:MAG TPA: hypothetical protein VNH38_02025 [Candidatus Dormibacteraeota bacterium]|nr:hypothetical protein [Candidatus Dormibacteraeota bacterium]